MQLLHDGYILHARAFSDSKLVLDIFTKSLGRVKAVARAPAKKNRAQFQVFQPLVLGFRGVGELKTLIQCEPLPNRRLKLEGDSLFCAMYINELVQRVVSVEDEDADLFAAYEAALNRLADTAETTAREAVLRVFEFDLVASAGYAINFLEDAAGARVVPAVCYRFDPQNGFVPAENEGISGESLIALGQGDFSQPQALRVAKAIARAALRPLLGERPIKSRELFR